MPKFIPSSNTTFNFGPSNSIRSSLNLKKKKEKKIKIKNKSQTNKQTSIRLSVANFLKLKINKFRDNFFFFTIIDISACGLSIKNYINGQNRS